MPKEKYGRAAELLVALLRELGLSYGDIAKATGLGKSTAKRLDDRKAKGRR